MKITNYAPRLNISKQLRKFVTRNESSQHCGLMDDPRKRFCTGKQVLEDKVASFGGKAGLSNTLWNRVVRHTSNLKFKHISASTTSSAATTASSVTSAGSSTTCALSTAVTSSSSSTVTSFGSSTSTTNSTTTVMSMGMLR